MKTIYLFIVLLYLSVISNAQQFDVATIQSNGENDARINLVILGDGYTGSEQDKFVTDATKFSNYLFTQSPFDSYRNYFNVHAVKVISNESGAKHPGTATDVNEPVGAITNPDNYFRSTFDFANIHRLLVPQSSSQVFSVLADSFPEYDQVFVLVNSEVYGGSGGTIATASNGQSSDEVAVHEMGHSFAALADEYYAGPQFNGERANMTQETDPTKVKWKNWYNDQNIGIFEHNCSGCGWYKPTNGTCKMQFLGRDFCAVCKERIIEVIHGLVDPLEDYTPNNDTPIIPNTDTTEFSLALIETSENDNFSIQWNLNNQSFNDTNQRSVELNTGTDLVNGQNTLEVLIEDQTTLQRIDNHQNTHLETVTWTITKNTLGIEDIDAIKNSIDVKLFPNPTKNIFGLQIKSDESILTQITVMDLQGRILIEKSNKAIGVNKQQFTFYDIDLSSYESGTYLVRIQLNNQIIERKMVKI